MTTLRGSLLVFVSGIVFSFGGLAFRLTEDITAWQYIVWRGLGAFVAAVVILALRQRGGLQAALAQIRRSHLLAGLLLAMMSAVFIVVLEHATVAFILFMQTLAPLTAAWFSWWFLRERISRAALVATLVAMLGVAIMVSATFSEGVSAVGLVAGVIPVMFGLYATVLRTAPDISPQVPVLVGGAVLFAVGVVVCAVGPGLAVSPRDALIGFLAGSLLLGLPVMLLNLGGVVVPAPETALLLMGEIVAAPIWVWLFVDEVPDARTIVGGAIMLIAVVGLLLWRREQSRRSLTMPAGAVAA